jgi:hypothetical protein
MEVRFHCYIYLFVSAVPQFLFRELCRECQTHAEKADEKPDEKLGKAKNEGEKFWE